MRGLKEIPPWAWLIVLAIAAMLLQSFGQVRYSEGFQDGLQNADFVQPDMVFLKRQAGEPIDE